MLKIPLGQYLPKFDYQFHQDWFRAKRLLVNGLTGGSNHKVNLTTVAWK